MSRTDSRPLAIFIGPDKSGSTWFYRLGRAHPDICTPVSKDLFFFDRFYGRGLDWYDSRFPLRPEHTVRLEVCHDYLYSDDAAHRIGADFPHARLVVCLRNPVDRAVSSYHYMVRQGRTRLPLDRALREIDELLDHGRYARHLTNYLERFPLAQLLALDFDDLVRDAREVAMRFFTFLGVTTPDMSPDLLAPARPATEARIQGVATFGKQIAGFLRSIGLESIVGQLKESRAIERALFRPLGESGKSRPTGEDFEFMRGAVGDDTVRLDALLGTDYSAKWWGPSSPHELPATSRLVTNSRREV